MKKIIKNLKTIDIFVFLLCVGLVIVQVWLDLELPKYMMQITTMLENSLTTVDMIVEKGIYMLRNTTANSTENVTVPISWYFPSRYLGSF